jgi:hypothetical protein
VIANLQIEGNVSVDENKYDGVTSSASKSRALKLGTMPFQTLRAGSVLLLL